jgi:hypothetical protein
MQFALCDSVVEILTGNFHGRFCRHYQVGHKRQVSSLSSARRILSQGQNTLKQDFIIEHVKTLTVAHTV